MLHRLRQQQQWRKRHGLCRCPERQGHRRSQRGAKIAAQAGTFHADALSQIPDVQSSTYPEFADLLTALKSGAIDGYIAEEPTALSVCGSNDELTYLPFKNNDTGFTATAADVGIAIGLKKGNALRDQINTVLAEITEEQKSQLMEQIVTLASGGTVTEFAVHCDAPATTTGTLKIGMECAYEPYNWMGIPTAAPSVPCPSAARQQVACMPTATMSRSRSMSPTVWAEARDLRHGVGFPDPRGQLWRH